MNVSVVIAAYNAADTLADTLESLLAQTSAAWEAIVVDDGSTDATPSIADAYAKRDARIRVVHQRNAGESGARNTGVDAARHEWMSFLDSDDWLATTFLERLTAALAADPSLDAVHCGWARVTPDGAQIVEAYEAPTGDMFATWARRSAFPVHACVVRTSLVRDAGKFDLALKRSADWDLWQRIARTGARFGAVREVLAFYRMRPQGVSLSARQMLHDGMTVLRRGHDRDPRVTNAHPDHVDGEPRAQVATQEFYLLAWCAGLMIGRGEDARPLLEEVKGDTFASLWPPAIAQCIFESATLPTCEQPAAWESLWPRVYERVDEFLAALEAQSRTPDLAAQARSALIDMIVQHSPAWRPVFDRIGALGAAVTAAEERTRHLEAEQERARQLSEEQERRLADRDRRTADHDRRIAEQERRLGELADAMADRDRRIADADRRIAEADRRTADEHRRASDREAELQEERAAHARTRHELEQRANAAEHEREQLRESVARLTRERDLLWHSRERRVGDLLLNRLALQRTLTALQSTGASLGHRAVRARLRLERLFSGSKPRVMTSICWNFPIYSQTFVYQELTQLQRNGFTVRVQYSKLEPREQLGASFDHLWSARRRLFLNRAVHERDAAYYHRKMPVRVAALLARISEASGLSYDDLVAHGNMLEAFSYTRLVEAYRPRYVHSYFFYDRSFMTLVAANLLGIPRGVTCYADHVMKDYELKLVPLHMEMADVVIATSNRIKRELLTIAPNADPDRIVVKPNGVDATKFPVIERHEPKEGEPFRIVTTCRIEPKKGLLDLVDAMALLRDRGVRVEAHIVGAPDQWSAASVDYKQRLDARISELNLWRTVHLEGRHSADGVRRFLSISQLFVAPFVETESGDKDGIPTALLEGMATGLPAVTTDAGSMNEVVENEREGLIVSQRNPAALADAIETMLKCPAMRAKCAVAAAASVREKFDVKVCEPRFHERVRALIRRP